MNDKAVQAMKSRIWRRIVIKSIVFAWWAAGMLFVALREGQDLSQSTYVYMVFAIVAMWAVSTVRDARRLRDENMLRKAAIAETDERNVMISYKATRLAVVIMACLMPIALFVLAYNDMQDVISALGFAVCIFLVVYLASWFYIARKS